MPQPSLTDISRTVSESMIKKHAEWFGSAQFKLSQRIAECGQESISFEEWQCFFLSVVLQCRSIFPIGMNVHEKSELLPKLMCDESHGFDHWMKIEKLADLVTTDHLFHRLNDISQMVSLEPQNQKKDPLATAEKESSSKKQPAENKFDIWRDRQKVHLVEKNESATVNVVGESDNNSSSKYLKSSSLSFSCPARINNNDSGKRQERKCADESSEQGPNPTQCFRKIDHSKQSDVCVAQIYVVPKQRTAISVILKGNRIFKNSRFNAEDENNATLINSIFRKHILNDYINGIVINQMHSVCPFFALTLGGFQFSSIDCRHDIENPDDDYSFDCESSIADNLVTCVRFEENAVTLDVWISSLPQNAHGNKMLIIMIIQVMVALELSQQIVNLTHYDLHCQNVLVCPSQNQTFSVGLANRQFIFETDFVVKIIDFGSASVTFDPQETFRKFQLPISCSQRRFASFFENSKAFDKHHHQHVQGCRNNRRSNTQLTVDSSTGPYSEKSIFQILKKNIEKKPSDSQITLSTPLSPPTSSVHHSTTFHESLISNASFDPSYDCSSAGANSRHSFTADDDKSKVILKKQTTSATESANEESTDNRRASSETCSSFTQTFPRPQNKRSTFTTGIEKKSKYFIFRKFMPFVDPVCFLLRLFSHCKKHHLTLFTRTIHRMLQDIHYDFSLDFAKNLENLSHIRPRMIVELINRQHGKKLMPDLTIIDERISFPTLPIRPHFSWCAPEKQIDIVVDAFVGRNISIFDFILLNVFCTKTLGGKSAVSNLFAKNEIVRGLSLNENTLEIADFNQIVQRSALDEGSFLIWCCNPALGHSHFGRDFLFKMKCFLDMFLNSISLEKNDKSSAALARSMKKVSNFIGNSDWFRREQNLFWTRSSSFITDIDKCLFFSFQ